MDFLLLRYFHLGFALIVVTLFIFENFAAYFSNYSTWTLLHSQWACLIGVVVFAREILLSCSGSGFCTWGKLPHPSLICIDAGICSEPISLIATHLLPVNLYLDEIVLVCWWKWKDNGWLLRRQSDQFKSLRLNVIKLLYSYISYGINSFVTTALFFFFLITNFGLFLS